jgi:hypothetical protein
MIPAHNNKKYQLKTDQKTPATVHEMYRKAIAGNTGRTIQKIQGTV